MRHTEPQTRKQFRQQPEPGNPPTRYKRISIQKSRNTDVSKKLI
nr:MAG TPA: hypothetical protein [Caudoviricetes sp.]